MSDPDPSASPPQRGAAAPPHAGPLVTDSASQQALQRLTASRAQLAQVLLSAGASGSAQGTGSAGGLHAWLPEPLAAVWQVWRRRLRRSAGAQLLLTGLNSWWLKQPWRHNAELLGHELGRQLLPLVRRHPLKSVAVAALTGAALLRWRPWRWASSRRTTAALAHPAGHWLRQQLAQVPLATVLNSLLLLWATRQAANAATGNPMNSPDDASPAGADNAHPARPDMSSG